MGFKGRLAALPGNRPKSAFFALFLPFSPVFCLFARFQRARTAPGKIQKTEEKGLFPQISSDFLKPPSLKPPFVAPKKMGSGNTQTKGCCGNSRETLNFPEFPGLSRFRILVSPFSTSPYCAIPRDYLSDTPLLRAMGFLVSQHGQLGAIPPPPFLSVSPVESMQSGGAIPPPQMGYLSDTGAIPYENKAHGCDTPLRDTISKGYCAIGGGYLALGR